MNKVARLIVVSSVVLVVSLSLLFLTAMKDFQIPYVSDGVHAVVSSINNVFSKPSQFFSGQKDAVADLIAAYDENKLLKQRVLELENQVADKESLQAENDSLRQNLQIVGSYTQKRIVAGMVAVRTPTAWSNHITVNVGNQDGISEDMLVVANGGLIGVVTKVYAHSADVTLLSSSDGVTKIPVKISTADGDIYGILVGYDTDTASFIISQLNSTATIAEGSNVVTSDLAGTTPSNIQIGKVAAVKTSSSNLGRELYVKPTASFSNIYSVLMIGEE